MDTISGDAASDRKYVNSCFFIIFPLEYIEKQIKKTPSRKLVLEKLRGTKRYETMNGQFQMKIFSVSYCLLIIANSFMFTDLFDYRVLQDGQGELNGRIHLFKLAFRSKFNGWWDKQAEKIIQMLDSK